MRTVTLVVVNAEGELLGQVPPFDVPTPWWQDVEPVVAVHPDLVVLRLLHVAPSPTGPMGGQVTYLAECASPPAGLDAFAGRTAWLEDHPLRLPWARPGGPASDIAWAETHVELTGPPRQIRTWNLSAIWRLPTADGERWLKCVPPFFAHEATVIAQLGPSPSLPSVVAAEGHRILLLALPGVDGYGATPTQFEEIIDALVGLQLGAPAGLRDLVPDWTGGSLRAGVEDVLRGRGRERPGLRHLLDGWDRRFDGIAECGLPDTVFHGDAHPGNARIDVSPPIILDWGDIGWGHPLLDLAVLDGLPIERAPATVLDHWLGCWADALPGSRPHQAWNLLEPVAAARGAVVFHRFLEAIEPSERIYHRDDVEPCLARAEKLASRVA